MELVFGCFMIFTCTCFTQIIGCQVFLYFYIFTSRAAQLFETPAKRNLLSVVKHTLCILCEIQKVFFFLFSLSLNDFD